MATLTERVAALEAQQAVLISSMVRAQDLTAITLLYDETLADIQASVTAIETILDSLNAKIAALGSLVTSSKSYLFTQAIANATWTVQHDLGTKVVSVIVFDDTDLSIDPSDYQIELNSTTKLTIDFTSAKAGSALVLIN